MTAIQFTMKVASLLSFKPSALSGINAEILTHAFITIQRVCYMMRLKPKVSFLTPLRQDLARDGIRETKRDKVGATALPPMGHIASIDRHFTVRTEGQESDFRHNGMVKSAELTGKYFSFLVKVGSDRSGANPGMRRTDFGATARRQPPSVAPISDGSTPGIPSAKILRYGPPTTTIRSSHIRWEHSGHSFDINSSLRPADNHHPVAPLSDGSIPGIPSVKILRYGPPTTAIRSSHIR